MEDLHVALGEKLLLALGDPYAMRGAQPRGREAGVGEVFKVREASRQAADDFHFLARLRRMGMDQRVFTGRQRGHRFEQIARAGHREARRKRGPQAPIGATVPSLFERKAFIDRSRRVLLKPRRRIV